MAILSRISNAIAHNLWEVTRDDTGKLVALSKEKKIASNYTNSAEWIGSFSNNHYFAAGRERFLSEPMSPATRTKKDLQVMNETQQDVANRYAGFRGNLRQARTSLKQNISDLQEQMAVAQKGGLSDEELNVYKTAISNARKELNRVDFRDTASWVKQAGAHTWRTLRWSQEGPMGDRLKKTAFLGASSVGVGTGLRTTQGGGMTYNPNGERDIAGIPFL